MCVLTGEQGAVVWLGCLLLVFKAVKQEIQVAIASYGSRIERLAVAVAAVRAVFGWGDQRHTATNRHAEQASQPNPTINLS
jgi:hypothetical protein